MTAKIISFSDKPQSARKSKLLKSTKQVEIISSSRSIADVRIAIGKVENEQDREILMNALNGIIINKYSKYDLPR